MGVLKNPKHELFAQAVASGTPVQEAFEKVGYTSERRNAIRLVAYDTVRARIDEIQSKSAARAVITAQKVLEELATIGFANVDDFIDRSSPKPKFDLRKATRQQMAAVSEIGIDRLGNIKSVRLYDKRAALVDIGTAIGMFKKTLALTGPDGGPIQTEDAQARAFILAEIQRLSDRAQTAADDEARTIDVEPNDDPASDPL